MEIWRLREHGELAEQAAAWFHEKWDIPLETYRNSIRVSMIGRPPVPQWYLAVEDGRIAGGLGVIDHEFCRRRDLTPDITSVYVETPYRCRGIAGMLLDLACSDLHEAGIDVVYLQTAHTGFYERYGWQFLCTVLDGDGNTTLRIYRHQHGSPR